MGLRDRIKERKERIIGMSQITGKRVIADSKEDFLKTVEELKSEFEGIMTLYGDINGDVCNASFLIQKGNVIGATFEYLETTILGDKALSAIKNKLAGSEGGMDLFQLEKKDMEIAIKQNKDALLKNPIPLSSTGIKIKYLMDSWIEEKKESTGKDTIKIPEILRERKGFNLLEIARSSPRMKKLEIPTYRAYKKGKDIHRNIILDTGRSIDEMEKLRKKRLREMEAAKKIGKVRVVKEESKRKVVGGEKVRTPIDRLLELVRKKKRVRIDDKLANKLGVNKTQIEEWAMILEDHNLVELHYPTIGGPEIRAIEK